MDRKEIIRRYKEAPRPAGVFRVQNRISGRTLVGASRDAPAMLNRIRAQLRLRSHTSRDLQKDWDALGPDAFEFEVLDLLDPEERAGAERREDLRVLEQLWVDKLGLSDDQRY